jgi:hypothetical protein
MNTKQSTGATESKIGSISYSPRLKKGDTTSRIDQKHTDFLQTPVWIKSGYFVTTFANCMFIMRLLAIHSPFWRNILQGYEEA